MSVGTPEELDGLITAGRAAARVLERMRVAVRPGVTTAALDALGARLLEDLGARSAPILDAGFPAATCISVNDCVAHGIPGPDVLREGDLVNIDVSLELDGFYADTGASFPVGAATSLSARLCSAGRQALTQALAAIRTGGRLNRIGAAAERTARAHGFRVIRDLCGHGLGRALREEPGDLFGWYDPQDRRRLSPGLVLAVEPFVSSGAEYTRVDADGWSLRTEDGALAVQFEHTVVVTDRGALVLTAPDPFLVPAA
jgi:methionyl aminopeptidase